MNNNIHVLEHPLIEHKLSILRDKNTGSKEFRELVREISMLMCYDITRDLQQKDVEVETPLGIIQTKVISGKKLVFVPILRAGLGMLEGMLALVPTARVGHIGLFRDPETLLPVEYYCKTPVDINERDVILLDPMLATGGSAAAAAAFIKKSGARSIKLAVLLAAPEGIARFCRDHPEIPIYCTAIDEKLNDHGYIIPGLGDAGDRIFGTK
jgi:uracil phosphoribosyltransferase